MHLTRPSYRGSRAFRASRLSPRIIMLSLPLSSLCSPFSSKLYLRSNTRNGTSWWWLITLLFPIHSSVGMADFLHNRVILISYEGFLPWPSSVMRVTSGYVCIAVIVVKDLSCLGRTKSLSNTVIVCRIDDLGRFVTRDQCAHSHPRGGIDPIISSFMG